ncbi:MAG: VIT domain-containing protein [Chitinophagaceae bacterium]
MTRPALFCLLAAGLVFSCAQVKKAHRYPPLPSAIPVLRISGDTTAAALKISSLSIDVTVAANIATTTFDISFYNPNNRVLEGEFDFPLADGQRITRYALGVNGALREGVVVEKAKARVAFENTVRRTIDPGLVEKTKGNNFRTRIYPLPAKGYKRIVIAIEQTLEQQSKDLLYQLPLYAQELIDSFSLKTTVIKSAEQPQLEPNTLANFQFRQWKNAFVAEHHQRRFRAGQTIAFSIPGTGDNEDVVLTENAGRDTYFYVNSRVEPQFNKKNKPASIGVFWDVSASGDKRDLAKETALLQQYLSGLGDAAVSLIPFHISAQPQEDFAIRGGDAASLVSRLKTLVYDGGTQLGAIDLNQYRFDEVLLFSDGLSTFGRHDLHAGSMPVTTITSSPSADYAYLKFIAQQTHGSFIDLGRQETASALAALQGQALQVINLVYDPAVIEDMVVQATPVGHTGLSFAGKLNASAAVVRAELGFGNQVTMTKTITITRSNESDYGQVKRIWAGLAIDRLELEYEKNKTEITRLGKAFSIVTQNTSLLVLDRVEDYVQYEITPPAELQKEYFSLLREKQKTRQDEKATAFNEALAAMTQLKEWWNTDYSERQQATVPVVIADSIGMADSAVAVRNPLMQYNAAYENLEIAGVSPDSFSVGAGDTRSVRMMSPSAGTNIAANRVSLQDGYFFGVEADGRADGYDKDKEEELFSAKSSIRLNEWKPDAPYLAALEKAAPAERISIYRSLKKQYPDQPSFFADVARFFLEHGDKPAGLLVLSNICEMKLENAELLRLVANQLLDAGEKELAVETLREVLKIREEEPQSYRDLALACNETGRHDEALELLYKLVLGTWDGRFGDVKAIALNELNAIASAHAGRVNISAVDPRFIYAMPVDVRIVVGWNTDNSDIDLWVTDPRKEKCFYEHKETSIGGKLSSDVTQGYGPEEFCLRKARNGNYTVEVNLYGDSRQTLGGPIAIRADLYTDFGRPTQQKKTVNLRVTSNKEVINIGSLKFGS